MTGTLYVVSTPIGNLGDVTVRALEILKSVSVIACEDTRVTCRLLARYGIKTRTVSYHEHNEKARAGELGAELLSGRDVALVSDAGTPGISDPGFRLLAWARAECVPVRAVPGPSAVLAALSLSGFGGGSFCFVGFLPLKPKARREAIAALASEPRPTVIFETARRAFRFFSELSSALGSGRLAWVGRELTKAHEEHRSGTLAEMSLWASGTRLKGEITLVVGGAVAPAAAAPAGAALETRFRELVASGLTRRDAVKALARESGLPRREVYTRVLGVETVETAETGPFDRSDSEEI